MLAVIRTMQLLDRLAGVPEGKGVLELSAELHIHKADVSRILSTLEAEGYVIRDPLSERYKISFKFVAMALRHQDRTQLEDVVHPVLVNLVQEIGESVQFAVEQNRQLIYVDRVDGIKPLRVASMLGRIAPLHATAAGKVWMASLPDEEVVALMQTHGMPAVTEHTITNIDDLLKELAKVREQGFAVSREEVNPTVFGLAAPVRDRRQQVRAVVVATLPMYEASEERVEFVRDGVVRAANEIAERLVLFW
ncbi:IclR family transcriptional regulator [Alicyclobacillus cycloheptanicus]|uniref:IclR family acetate operon transcriptional repressor n=1 Tax=Alicyclobacillus cycloheptanicus TaxID=1457 RepID=A0ABT9XG16_9BACL|nr:IclR family transcriptional regulator [Alicyclobacillus cycloheptanicus]MDQ0189065.1 IclR family acetate operon transcriptional repressor [Alicyclobacillus cycloheptanicus]WDM00201.1 IclR family transcriptional regulator [Alicyclobacillus cycloheptanicus]